MMLSRDTLERKDLPIIGGKSCKKFLQNHASAESWTFALEVCYFFAHVGLKSNQQLESAVETCSSGEFCKSAHVLPTTYFILLEYLYILLRLP